MAGTDDSFALRVWSLATFHAASFVATAVVGFHWSGALAGALKRLDTGIGFAFFLLLWTTTWFATRKGVRLMRLDDGLSESIVLPTIVAAGWNGLYVLSALLVAFVVVQAREIGAAVLVVVTVGSTLGGVLAFTIGALVGLVYGLVDAALLRLGARLFEWAGAGNDRPMIDPWQNTPKA